MRLIINEKCNCGFSGCEAIDYISFKLWRFRFNFGNDCGYKFIDVSLGNKFKRWMF